MGAVGGLVLRGRIPPGVIVDHRIRCREVESTAAGLEADEKQGDLPGLEAAYRQIPVLGAPGELYEVLVLAQAAVRERLLSSSSLAKPLTLRALSSATSRGSQHTWRNLSRASRIMMPLRARPLRATSWRTRSSMASRRVS